MKRVLLTVICSLVVCGQAQAHGLVSSNNQWGYPSGHPKGWVLVIHGGGWQTVGKTAVISMRPFIQIYHQHGWGTYNIDYRKAQKSLGDVEAAYDFLRRRVGTTVPVCVLGGSAGAHLALMLAAYRSSVSCVIAEGAPTDLVHYDQEDAYPPAPGLSPNTGPRWLYNTAIVPSFGSSESSLWWWSPVRVASRIHVPVLLGLSTYDQFVPQAQMVAFKQANPRYTKTLLLSGTSTLPGQRVNFTHASITSDALSTWNKAELTLLHRVIHK